MLLGSWLAAAWGRFSCPCLWGERQERSVPDRQTPRLRRLYVACAASALSLPVVWRRRRPFFPSERRRETRMRCIDRAERPQSHFSFFARMIICLLPWRSRTDARGFVGLNHDKPYLQRRAPGTSRARGAESANPRTVPTSSIGSVEPIYGAALDVMDVRLQCALHRLG